jgi:tripeptide aminopeptidase
MSGMTDQQATKLLMDLMAIPGPSGRETQVADFIRRQLLAAGAPASALHSDQAHRRISPDCEVGNLVLRLPGTVREPRRMLSAHMDTVPICVGCQPIRRGKRISAADPQTGLGGDDRAGVAILLSTAMEILKRNLPHPPLTFLWTVHEEGGLHGARHVRLGMLGKPKLAFNFDGSDPNRLTIGATGGYRMNIEIRGIASHAGGHPEQGVSAIAVASLAVTDLVNNGWHGLIEKGRHRGTSNVGVIEGGVATNVVADLVRVRVEARSHEPKFRKRIVREIEKAFRKAAKQVKSSKGKCGQVTIQGQLDYEAFRLSRSEPSVQAAAAAVEAVGVEVDYAIANGGLDANWLVRYGIPTVSLGCGQKNQHTVDEALDLDGFQQACRIGLALATGLGEEGDT